MSGHPSPSTASTHKPYQPRTWSLGSPANKRQDIAPSAIFMLLFLACLIAAIQIMRRNVRNNHKFLLIRAFISFAAIRTVASALRIALAVHPTHVPLAMAATIFVIAGSFILYVVNIFFFQRLLRAYHPHLGWTRFGAALPWVHMALNIGTLLVLLVSVIQSNYTRDEAILKKNRNMLLAGTTAYMFSAFLPTICLAVMFAIPRRTERPVERFGTIGGFKSKVLILLASSLVLTLGAGFRMGTNWLPPVPLNQPQPWYFSKACFYLFDLSDDLVALAAYLALRVDLRFYVNDGAKGPGDFEKVLVVGHGEVAEKKTDMDVDVEMGRGGESPVVSLESIRSLDSVESEKKEGEEETR